LLACRTSLYRREEYIDEQAIARKYANGPATRWRGGWISRADLERESEGLPDASGKIAEEEAEPNPDESEAATPEADPQMPG
jgi:hypothetical protein